MADSKKYNGSTWEHSLRKLTTATDTLTTLPVDIYADGNNATVGLKGNTVQSGTPTPDNPIMPQGTGERTGNLFDYRKIVPGYTYDSDGQMILNPDTVNRWNFAAVPLIEVEPGATYLRTYNLSPIGNIINFYDSNKNFLEQVSPGSGIPVTVPSDCNFVSFVIQINDMDAEKYMFTKGSTPPETYEPYGYKIPILTNSITTPVYLGEVETTRKVKKLVLDGTENWTYRSGDPANVFFMYLPTAKTGEVAMSNAYPYYSGTDFVDMNDKEFAIIRSNLAIRNSNYQYESQFKAYLAQQYANGTPVCVWYVLATETTGIVNEPIQKIGDYADTVSGVTIPTIAGANTLSVNTTIPPSEVTVNYKGWHNMSNVHIYPDSSWMPISWEEFRKAVRSGKAQSLYPVGTKLYENWGDTTSDAWIVVDYPTGEDYLDSDLAQQGYTNRVMLMEEKLNYLRVFDAKEAWLYVETAIPAGTYRFTIPNYDASYGGNKTYIFTSTANVPVGGQLTLTWAYNTNPTKVQGYSSSTSTTALFDVNIAEWDGTTACTDLGTIKLAMADADSAYGKLNHIHRARYGSNNYYQSGLRQWLNADATANNWWTPTNIFDRPHDNRSTAGRLNVLNSNMKAVLATPTVNCITNNLFEYPSLDGTTFSLQTAYTVKDKLFLVTHTETNLSSTPNVNSVLDYYVNAGNENRIKYRKDNGNAYYWWLRTPYPTTANYVRVVYTSGALNSSVARNALGAAAACIIQ